MTKKVQIDEEECIGCGTCVELCKDIFVFKDNENKAYVIKEEGGDEDCVNEAIGSCPAECITYE